MQNLKNFEETCIKYGYYVGISESVSLLSNDSSYRVVTQIEGQGGPQHFKYKGNDPSKANNIFLREMIRIYTEMMNEGLP